MMKKRMLVKSINRVYSEYDYKHYTVGVCRLKSITYLEGNNFYAAGTCNRMISEDFYVCSVVFMVNYFFFRFIIKINKAMDIF